MSPDTASKPIPVVLCWHMHQPDYRNHQNGHYDFPWTYLHALKDYSDMLRHLQAQPQARAVVNFSPILLEQLEDYREQVDGWLDKATPIRDSILAALVQETLPEPGSDAFWTLANHCLRAQRGRMIERFPAYRFLADTMDVIAENPQQQCYLNPQYLIDLVVWYHLAWLGEFVRREDPRVYALEAKGGGFTPEDRTALMKVIADQFRALKPGYKQLWEEGRIELSMSPYAHPILPLLLDFASAREAMPDVVLPKNDHYPGGRARAQWHIERGLDVFERYFGGRPSGCWASEGALSDATLTLLEESGFFWTATGDSVLHNSLQNQARSPHEHTVAHRAFTVPGQSLRCFFRDDGLSDLIGFQYADWHAEDAVGDLINHLVSIAESSGNPDDTVISIIMDGENAWEYYPENAWHFLEALYRRIATHERLTLTTYHELLSRESPPEPVVLDHLVAGSWVYGTFSTWLGDADKNLAWDRLCDAKRAYDQHHDALDEKAATDAEQQLAQCEGSDWFWWLGDYNPAESVRDFDVLYRRHLSNLYTFLQQPVPENLSHPLSQGGGSPQAGGVMRRGHEEHLE